MSRYQWDEITGKAAFAPRDGAGALVFKDKMWMLGGWNPPDTVNFPRKCNSEVWSSTDGANWMREAHRAPWEPRHTAGYVVHQDHMWIVGGDPLQGHYQDDVWKSADGVNWTQVTGRTPWSPRVLHHTVQFKGRIWVIGGQTMPHYAAAPERFHRDIWNTVDGVNWQQVTPAEPYWPQRGMIGGAAVLHDRIWILGGGTYDTPAIPARKYFNDVWSSSDGICWEQHTSGAPWMPRQYHDIAAFDNQLWVLEGYNENGGNRNDVWRSPDGVNWFEVPNTPWAPRHAAGVYVYKNALWMVAGNNMEADVWRLSRV